eukprot:m.243822 g.243822  ORF g.243822 m.243822 type:complete len:75 (+) comp19463_c0_seq3:131-355(+)
MTPWVPMCKTVGVRGHDGDGATGGPIDAKRFPLNHENLRGMVDVYGQLSADYATQKGDQMAPIGAMMKHLMGLP